MVYVHVIILPENQDALAVAVKGLRRHIVGVECCLAVNLLEEQDINSIMEQVRKDVDLQAPVKEKAAIVAKLFQAMADEKGLVLKLRK